jgi:hypothetical protein
VNSIKNYPSSIVNWEFQEGHTSVRQTYRQTQDNTKQLLLIPIMNINVMLVHIGAPYHEDEGVEV